MMLWSVLAVGLSLPAAPPPPPNVVLIVADDLGAYDLGCYGQTKIRTPHVDRLAAGGVRFTQFYAGAPVCAPSRCSLLTGRHMGRAAVRDNREIKPEGQVPIPADAATVSAILKARGYAVGGFGKWGLGMVGTSGDPLRHGFDRFFGYNCQRHAHFYYPKYLRDNDRIVELPGNDSRTGTKYSHDLIEQEALGFLTANRDRPFFLFLPATLPHLALQIPEDDLAAYRGGFPEVGYDGKKGYLAHPTPRAAYAAMVTRLDTTVGRVVDRLKELGLTERTLVIFTSDNGPTFDVGGADSKFFGSAGPLRGLKGQLYEGGIRVPLVAAWPGTIPPGRVDATPLAFWDVLPTLAELAGAKPPAEIEGISFVPALTGQGTQPTHAAMYWETPAGGGAWAVRRDGWKAVRRQLRAGKLSTELYDLAADPGETADLAAGNPETVARMERTMLEQRRRSAVFPLPGIDGP